MEIFVDTQIIYIKKKILEVSSKNPNWISESDTALSAIEKMNRLGIQQLLVTNKKQINKKIKNLVGILHIHHCLSRGIKLQINKKKFKFCFYQLVFFWSLLHIFTIKLKSFIKTLYANF